ncbi:MAG: ABC transporter permease [Acidobacteria bacterium]|nr:ABC transporter permease [Acidobacteriota bacterium]
MAVYKRTYKGYEGAQTPEWSRFLILPRYAWESLFKQRFLLIFYVICFFYPIGAGIFLYINANLGMLASLIEGAGNLKGLEIDGKFFYIFSSVQGSLAFILTAFIGPGLISPDLSNSALPLYFCRPFSRTEYVAGKLGVVAFLLSFITWIPGLLLFLLQWSVGPEGWFAKYSWIAPAIFLSNVMWILLISLLALALSAWVRWKVVAGALLLLVFFLSTGLAAAINAVMRTDKGSWLDITSNSGRISLELFRVREFMDYSEGQGISIEEAWVAQFCALGFCLWLLWKKIRAYEVIK